MTFKHLIIKEGDSLEIPKEEGWSLRNACYDRESKDYHVLLEQLETQRATSAIKYKLEHGQ